MYTEVELLTETELRALCGLLRLVVLADGAVDGIELDALDAIGHRVAPKPPGDTPYREAKPPAMGPTAFRAFFGEANHELPTKEDVREAALRVTRPEAREILYALLFDVAAADGVHPNEQAILSWLEERWSLETRPSLE